MINGQNGTFHNIRGTEDCRDVMKSQEQRNVGKNGASLQLSEIMIPGSNGSFGMMARTSLIVWECYRSKKRISEIFEFFGNSGITENIALMGLY